MENELVLIETTIQKADAAANKADLYLGKSVEMKKAAGLTYIEARVLCQTAGIPWVETLMHYTTIKKSRIYQLIKIASADDPDAEDARQRERTRNQQDTFIGKNSIIMETDDVTDVIDPGPAKTSAILTRVNQLTKTELKEFLYALADQVKPLGISMSFTIM